MIPAHTRKATRRHLMFKSTLMRNALSHCRARRKDSE